MEERAPYYTNSVPTEQRRFILGIDPGPQHKGHGFAMIRKDQSVKFHGMFCTADLHEVLFLSAHDIEAVCIEMISSYGMAVGADVFRTIVEIGRLVQILVNCEIPVYLPVRKDIKLVICGTSQAKDANVRAAILSMYPQTGGGSTPAYGTKKQKGPLYGLKSHSVPALAAALWYLKAEQERGIDICLSKYEPENGVKFF